ncbi:MAG: hypothetical protein JWL61_3551 [Gemmatimonadetes bacterium]|nr:hypothetical protein [Gemmatimonadota bacterium]
MTVRRIALALLLSIGTIARVEAQQMPNATSAPVPGSEITVTLVTFGLGQEVFERFGHNALMFQDARTQESIAYHWGLFSFNEPGFLVRFLTGETKYWMGGVDASALIDSERRAGRPITLQRLNLTPAQALALRDYVRWNALDENKYYRYDYYRDNCSTRLRDALDRVIGGAIKRKTAPVVTNLSYRRETVRLLDGMKPVQLGTEIALGRPADAPLTQWESFFIPMRLRDAIRDVKIVGANGQLVPLVAQEGTVPLPPTPPAVQELTSAPELKWRYAALGLALAALVVFLRIMMVSLRGAAWGLALFGSVWSLLGGLIGVILLLAWFATKHVFWAYNENVLLLSPLALLLIVLIPASLLRGKAERATRMIAALVAGLGVIALVLALVPGGEENGALVALVVPVHLALAWALALPRGNARA